MTTASGSIIMLALSSAKALASAVQKDKGAGKGTKTLAEGYTGQFDEAKAAIATLEGVAPEVHVQLELVKLESAMREEALSSVAAVKHAQNAKDWARVAHLQIKSDTYAACAQMLKERREAVAAGAAPA